MYLCSHMCTCTNTCMFVCTYTYEYVSYVCVSVCVSTYTHQEQKLLEDKFSVLGGNMGGATLGVADGGGGASNFSAGPSPGGVGKHKVSGHI